MLEQNDCDGEMANTDNECIATEVRNVHHAEYSSSGSGIVKRESEWIHRNVLLFLEECQKRKQALINKKIRRQVVLKQIQKALKNNKIFFKIRSLDNKLRNCKLRYTKIYESNLESARRNHMRWPYYHQLDDIYGESVRAELVCPEDHVRMTSVPTVNASLPLSPCSPDILLEDTPCNVSNIEHKPSTSSSQMLKKRICLRKSETIEEKRLAVEEEKLIIDRDLLRELKEIRFLKYQQLDLIKATTLR